jgi:hypothetical protein
MFWMKINGKKVVTPDVTIWPFRIEAPQSQLGPFLEQLLLDFFFVLADDGQPAGETPCATDHWTANHKLHSKILAFHRTPCMSMGAPS